MNIYSYGLQKLKDVHVEWLTAHYQEAPANGPEAKRVKFSELKNDLETQFATSKLSSYALSERNISQHS